MRLLDCGLGFPVVQKATKWLQEALSSGMHGNYLFWAERDDLTFLTDNPEEIKKLIKGNCVITIDLAQIINQLKEDIEIIKTKRETKKGNRKSYAAPKIA